MEVGLQLCTAYLYAMFPNISPQPQFPLTESPFDLLVFSSVSMNSLIWASKVLRFKTPLKAKFRTEDVLGAQVVTDIESSDTPALSV